MNRAIESGDIRADLEGGLEAALEGFLVDEFDLDGAVVFGLELWEGGAIDVGLFGDEGGEDEIGRPGEEDRRGAAELHLHGVDQRRIPIHPMRPEP